MNTTKMKILPDGNCRVTIPIEFHYKNGCKRIFFPDNPVPELEINQSLATGIARAYRWQEMLDSGQYQSPEEIAQILGVHATYVRRVLRLTHLAAPIVEAIFNGTAPWQLTLSKIMKPIPGSWAVQCKSFGIPLG